MKIQKFIRFLKENNAYDKYVSNFQQHPNINNDGNILTCLERAFKQFPNKPLETTVIGFDWCHSNEGSQYWRALSDKYKVKNL